MKCIAYVSRTPVSDLSMRMPTGLSDIISVSRKHNPELNITGIISYRQGQYLQVLEGPSTEVDRLMAKIGVDPRHQDIWVFLNKDVTKRSFQNWGVSVFDFVDQGIFFETFIEDNRAIINGFDEQQKSRIKPFINVTETDSVLESRFEGKNLKLLAWPDLNNQSNPQMIMELCIKLTKKPYPFDLLVRSGEFGTVEEVTKILKDFEQLGILNVTEPEALEPVLEEQTISEKKPNKFYGAIKKLLGMG
ncbi:BLUF domain-containing protein [Psychrobacter sp. B38]|uniref:BLUF domain-containing protein n=1 Tax=Psychrobacter sp. B38 TaxID=3143538 RepID=UPI00320F420A